MRVAELRDRVLTKLGEEQYSGFDIDAALPTCLNRLAQIVASGSNKELLRKEFLVDVHFGVGDLTDAVSDDEPLMLDYVWFVKGSTTMHRLPDRAQLELKRSLLLNYYCIDGLKIRTNVGGSLSALNTTLEITGSYIPALIELPNQLDDDLTDLVTAYVQNQVA